MTVSELIMALYEQVQSKEIELSVGGLGGFYTTTDIEIHVDPTSDRVVLGEVAWE